LTESNNSPTLERRIEQNVQSPDNIDLDKLETRSKNRQTPQTGAGQATPRTRRTASRTKIHIKKEPQDDLTFETANVKTSDSVEAMARARTPGFNDTPKHLYGE
jgi:hypothetical protein